MSLLLMALLGLIFGVMIGGGGFASAAKPVNIGVDDYSQCTDGTADDDFKECTGWINGILNTNNSTYHEDEVTPQRLVVSGLPEGPHSFLLRYLVKKANAHAYDSLATWNFTQTAADPCQGLTGQVKSACDGVVGDGSTGASTSPVPADSLGVPSACNNPADTSSNTITSNHQLAGQQFKMWGGTLDQLTPAAYKGTFTDSEGEYESILVTFNTTGPNSRVFFYFGGHLAAGANTGNPSSPRGWGANCGAGSINGGPYHIKLDGIDGASAGNRDNQIMSGAVLLLPPITPSLSTTPSASVEYSATLSDSLSVGVSDAGGTADFYLYDNLTDCQANTTANAVGSATGKTVTSGSAASGDITFDPGPATTTTYYWYVSYSGDANHSPPVLAGTSVCTETSTITPPGAS
jgi:hypothetical protein